MTRTRIALTTFVAFFVSQVMAVLFAVGAVSGTVLSFEMGLLWPGLTGVYGHIKDLSNTDRDIKLDPFDAQVSLIVVGGELAANGSGPLSIDSPLSVELYRVSMLAPTKSSGISFTGILGERQDEILDLLVRQQKAVLIDPVERQTEMQD